MKRISIPVVLGLLLLGSTPLLAQNFEYINLRQFRNKSNDDFAAFVKHAYPYFNKSAKIPAMNRLAGTGESGRSYSATYFANYDQFTSWAKEFGNVFEEYSKTPGNMAQKQMDNVEGGIDDVLWQVNKDMSNAPAGIDVSKMNWRKLFFVTVKSGMMDEFVATRKKLIEADKKLGISYPVLYLTAAYGAPSNLVLISVPAANAQEFYTAAAARVKLRDASPEATELWKKFRTLSSNTLIDQVTMIPY